MQLALNQVFALFGGLPRARFASRLFPSAKQTGVLFTDSCFAEVSVRNELHQSRLGRFFLVAPLVNTDLADPAAARGDSQRKFRLPKHI